jgi:hypothetical protein
VHFCFSQFQVGADSGCRFCWDKSALPYICRATAWCYKRDQQINATVFTKPSLWAYLAKRPVEASTDLCAKCQAGPLPANRLLAPSLPGTCQKGLPSLDAAPHSHIKNQHTYIIQTITKRHAGTAVGHPHCRPVAAGVVVIHGSMGQVRLRGSNNTTSHLDLWADSNPSAGCTLVEPGLWVVQVLRPKMLRTPFNEVGENTVLLLTTRRVKPQHGTPDLNYHHVTNPIHAASPPSAA